MTVESLDEDIEAFVMGNTPSIVCTKTASERESCHKADEIPTKDHWIYDGESGELVRARVEPRTKLGISDVRSRRRQIQ